MPQQVLFLLPRQEYTLAARHWRRREHYDASANNQPPHSRMIWSLSNAFTSAFKELDPIPQFKATANRGEFLEARFSQSF